MSEKMPERIVARKSGYWGLDAPARPGRDWVGEYVRADLLAAAEAALKVGRERAEKLVEAGDVLASCLVAMTRAALETGAEIHRIAGTATEMLPEAADRIAEVLAWKALALDPKPSTPEKCERHVPFYGTVGATVARTCQKCGEVIS